MGDRSAQSWRLTDAENCAEGVGDPGGTGPTAFGPGPATTPAAARPSASSCPMPCTSIAPRWRPSTRCSASTRAAPGPTSARSRRQPDQAAPPLGQGLVPRLSRLRRRPAPGLAAEHQAQPADPRDREHRLRRQRQPAGPASQGGVPAARRPAASKVRAADPPGGAGRAARRDRDDRHAGRLGGAAAGAGVCTPGAPVSPDFSPNRLASGAFRDVYTCVATIYVSDERTPDADTV